MQSTAGKLTRQFAKPIINGAVAAGGMSVAFGYDRGFYIGGTRVPVPVVGFALGALSSWVSETINVWILPYTIGKDDKVRKLESMVLSIGSSAALFAIVPKVLNGDTEAADMTKCLVVGGGSEFVSEYIYTGFVAGPNSVFGGKY